jgi:putative heme transporter
MAAEKRRRLVESRGHQPGATGGSGGASPPMEYPDEDLLPDEDPSLDDSAEDRERDEDEEVGRLQALLSDRRKLATGAVLVVVIVVAIYVLLPNLVGAEEAVEKLDEAVWYWVVAAVVFNVLAFAAYVALFRGILGGTHDDAIHRRLDARASYLITMAGLAATRIFSAGGAGGIALTYWALRKAGMPRRRSACRMVAFFVLTYAIYLMALVIFGILLRTHVLPGEAPVGGTIVPAALAAGVMAIFLLIALIPQDFERRIQRFAGGYRRVRYLQRLAKGPATVATGVRTALAYLRHPRRGALAVGGAVGFWAANIAVLWASFEAFGGDVPFAVLVQGFFVGMAANLIPSPAGGVGSVDAGMIFAFDVLFGVPSGVVFPAVLTYRVIAFWLPIPPGVVAFFQLRATVAQWEREREPAAVAYGATLQKVK